MHQFTSNAKNGILKNIQGIESSFLDCSLDYGLLESFQNFPRRYKLKIGDLVKVISDSHWYDGETIPNFVYNNVYNIIEISNDRVVIGTNGKITGAIKINNIIKIK